MRVLWLTLLNVKHLQTPTWLTSWYRVQATLDASVLCKKKTKKKIDSYHWRAFVYFRMQDVSNVTTVCQLFPTFPSTLHLNYCVFNSLPLSDCVWLPLELKHQGSVGSVQLPLVPIFLLHRLETLIDTHWYPSHIAGNQGFIMKTH